MKQQLARMSGDAPLSRNRNRFRVPDSGFLVSSADTAATPRHGQVKRLGARRLTARLVRSTLNLCLASAAACSACTLEVSAPPRPGGFLAVLLNAEGPAEISPGTQYLVRIRETSGTLGIDDTIRAAPIDTIVRAYPVATYDVFVDSVPETCTSRFGRAQRALISSEGNTSIARFNFICKALLTVMVYADGQQVDSSYVWSVAGPTGVQFGVAGTADTIRLDNISAGDYTVELGHIAENCVLLSDGFRQQTITIEPPRASTLSFRVRCSNPAQSPHVLHVGSSIRSGVSSFYAEVVDPERDIAAYAWNITDCFGNTLFTKAGVTRDQLRFEPAARTDTTRIVATVALPDSAVDVSRACTTLIFTDLRGNTSPWIEERNHNETGTPPVIESFDVTHQSGSLVTSLSVSDADVDLAGIFMSLTLRDGTLTPPDGKPDVGIYNVSGYLSPDDIPALRLSRTAFGPADVLSVVVDAIDRAGNRTRAVDTHFPP